MNDNTNSLLQEVRGFDPSAFALSSGTIGGYETARIPAELLERVAEHNGNGRSASRSRRRGRTTAPVRAPEGGQPAQPPPRDPARDQAYAERAAQVQREQLEVIDAGDRVELSQSNAARLYGELGLAGALAAIEKHGANALGASRLDAMADGVYARRAL